MLFGNTIDKMYFLLKFTMLGDVLLTKNIEDFQSVVEGKEYE